MATPAVAHAELSRLRRDIARIEGRLAEEDRLPDAVPPRVSEPVAGPREKPRGRLAFGIAPLDAALGGGLPLAALHEIDNIPPR